MMLDKTISGTVSITNEDELDELIQSLVRQIQTKLKSDLLLREIFIPNAKAEAKCNIFASHDYAICPKICIFMQTGSGIKPGIWSTSISAKTGFKSSMIPYLKTALQGGYGVIIMNPSTNTAIVNGHTTKIVHSTSPQDHVRYVWKHYIAPNAAQEINFIAYGAAGHIVKYLLKHLTAKDEKRIGGIVFIESMHAINSSDQANVRKIISCKGVNFEASGDPTFAEIDCSLERLGCISLSVGRAPSDETTRDWTIQSVQTSAFVFLRAISMGMDKALAAIRASFPNKVVVTVNRARLTGQPYNNPFAVIQCVGQKKETIGNHKHTMDPEWNQTFSFPVRDANESVCVSIRDKVFPLGTTSLGFFIVRMNEIGLNCADRKWHPLRNEKDGSSRGYGEVELTLEWVHDTFVARSDTLLVNNKLPRNGIPTDARSKSSNSQSLKTEGLPAQINDSNCCHLCNKSFLLHRRRYCRMCLRVVCAACSERLFLPGFSEAKRVCLGCCDFNSVLQNKVSCYRGTSGETLEAVSRTCIHDYLKGQKRLTDAEQLVGIDRDIQSMRFREMENEELSKPLTIDNFELLKVVGRGAFGKVLLVRKKVGKNAQRIYAMKILVKAHIIQNGQIENTRAEQHILKEINHPFVVRLRFAFQNFAKLYLIMDYYPGGSLFHHLRKSKRFEEKRAQLYMAQLLCALMHLHEKQIAYRDLKLENLLMDKDGNIALTDFGLSKEEQMVKGALRASQAQLGMNTICGTAEYMAPELLRQHPYTKTVDWWSYGILMYEMLTGKTPFVDRNRRQMFKNIMQAEVVYPEYVSQDARLLISKLLIRDPAKRLGSGDNGRDIMAQPFYQEIDWDKLLRKEYEPPYIPCVLSDDDVTNIPEMYRNMEVIDSPSNLKQNEGHHFEDFSFQEQMQLNV